MNRRAKLFLTAGLCGLLISGAGAAVGPHRDAPQPAPHRARANEYRSYTGVALAPDAEPDARPLVWVVDGAGGMGGCSTALALANALAGNAVELSPFSWSHGYRKLVKDQTDWAYSRAQGERLAAAILERKKREPNRRVVLVAHSAGSAVALSAGDHLPPDSIDRTILLAPSVSTGYDLRPALCAAKEGVDVFCSHKDRLALGLGVRVVGTADRGSGGAAGRFGFRPHGAAALDPAQGARLRQHFWSAEQARTGNTGGHHGTHSTAFIHAYLFPLIGAATR